MYPRSTHTTPTLCRGTSRARVCSDIGQDHTAISRVRARLAATPVVATTGRLGFTLTTTADATCDTRS